VARWNQRWLSKRHERIPEPIPKSCEAPESGATMKTELLRFNGTVERDPASVEHG